MQIEINHPLEDFNLNSLVNAARANKFGSASKKKKLMAVLFYQIKPQVNETLDEKYNVQAIWRVPNKNRDLDNLLLKAIFDCMQEHKLLANDNLNHIVSIHHEFELSKQQGVTLKFVKTG